MPCSVIAAAEAPLLQGKAQSDAAGKAADASLAIIDSQSVKTTEKGAFAVLMATSG